jgi:hypothetical protein
MKNKLLTNEYQDILSTEDCVLTAMENNMTEEKESEQQAVEVVEEMSALKRAMLLKKSKKKARKTLEKQGFDKSLANRLVKNAMNRIASNKPMKKAAGRGG